MKHYEQPAITIRVLTAREDLCNGTSENEIVWDEDINPQAGL